jgi:tetratricopeptide (TPR) repeat protein
VSACLLLLLLFLIWTAGRAGFASLLATYAARTTQLAAADAAVRVSPNDPENHYIRGAILEAGNDLPAAISEYRQAAALRPDDYVLWLSLAKTTELTGDSPAAIAAATQAVKLAPYYAQPHWQLGNILVRAGQRDGGLKELRLAGASNPTLLPAIIDLAWQLSGGDAEFVARAIQPETPDAYKALAQYFKQRGKTSNAIEMLRAAGSPAEKERQQYLSELIEAKRFPDAYHLWSAGQAANSANIIGALRDPGFEQESNLDEAGFSWRAENKAQTVSLSLDSVNPKAGQSSLRIEFKGDSDPGPPLVSQLVLLEPRSPYQLHFSARSEKIVSGGLPQITVTDAGSNTVLGQPVRLPQQTSNWQDYVIDFSSSDTTTAIKISLQRERCSRSPCPIFGVLWLDNFSLRKL